MYYGITYFQTGDFQKALEKFELGIQMNKNADLFLVDLDPAADRKILGVKD